MTQGNNPKFCDQCGNPLRETSKFCSECGNPMISIPTQSKPFQPIYPTEDDILFEQARKRESNVARNLYMISAVVFLVLVTYFGAVCIYVLN